MLPAPAPPPWPGIPGTTLTRGYLLRERPPGFPSYRVRLPAVSPCSFLPPISTERSRLLRSVTRGTPHLSHPTWASGVLAFTETVSFNRLTLGTPWNANGTSTSAKMAPSHGSLCPIRGSGGPWSRGAAVCLRLAPPLRAGGVAGQLSLTSPWFPHLSEESNYLPGVLPEELR